MNIICPLPKKKKERRTASKAQTPHGYECSNSEILLCVGFPGGASGKEPTCQCERHKRLGYVPWVGQIPGEGNAWRIPGTEAPGGLQSVGSQESDTEESPTEAA